jgi:hypothetical protein
MPLGFRSALIERLAFVAQNAVLFKNFFYARFNTGNRSNKALEVRFFFTVRRLVSHAGTPSYWILILSYEERIIK